MLLIDLQDADVCGGAGTPSIPEPPVQPLYVTQSLHEDSNRYHSTTWTIFSY